MFRKSFVWYVGFTGLLLGMLALIFMVAGCGTIRKHSSKIVHSDTVTIRKDSIIYVRTTDSVTNTRVIHDTVIGVAGNTITSTAKRDTIIRRGHLQLSVRGNTIDCSADSLTLVVTNLVRDSVSQRHTNDSMYYEYQRLTTHVADLEQDKQSIRKPSFLAYIFRYIIAAIVGAVVWELGKRFV